MRTLLALVFIVRALLGALICLVYVPAQTIARLESAALSGGPSGANDPRPILETPWLGIVGLLEGMWAIALVFIVYRMAGRRHESKVLHAAGLIISGLLLIPSVRFISETHPWTVWTLIAILILSGLALLVSVLIKSLKRAI